MKLKTQTITIKVDQVNLPNKLHFDVQRNNRMQIFRDRTKYSRKIKHKKQEE